jgi:peptidoglycan hydrolase CwlO-like protein
MQMRNFSVFFSAVVAVVLLSSCASGPSPNQLSALNQQRSAADAAERRVQALVNERDALQQELNKEQANQDQLKAEMKSLEGNSP